MKLNLKLVEYLKESDYSKDLGIDRGIIFK